MSRVEFNAESIPAELKERDQWLLWDASNDTPRQPHWDGDFYISWSDPDDWHSFEDAVEKAESVESWGIGYVMAKDNSDHPHGLYGCLDLDGCLSGPESPKDWLPSLADFIDEDAYIERSPSGGGLHIPLVGQEAPDWWADAHFSDDEHEGVEYLTNKFCTFTGDPLFDDYDGVGSVDPTDFLFHAYTKINGESPRVEPSESAKTHDADGFELDEDDVREALGHIDPGCAYPKWRDIAFAVHDWDSGPTGKRVFENWSRGSGWDDESERYIEAIWSSAEQGSGVTVGTLIHHAKEGGWSPPSRRSSRVQGRESPSEVVEATEDPDWERVRELYALAQEESSIDKGPARQAAEEVLEAETSWMCVNESDRLWVYDDDSGTYGKFGEPYIGTRLKDKLAAFYTKAERSEIIARIKDGNRVFRRELNARQEDGALLCVGNGVVDFDTGELLDHDPEYRFVRGLETEYPTAENALESDKGRVLDFIDDITQREADRDTLLDHLAHGLMPGHPYRAFLVAFGPGGNGKTQLAQLFTGFVGEDNAANVEIDELVNDAFATGDLPGKFLNWGDDMSGDGGGKLKELSTLKKASGGSNIRANEKYEKTFNFKNEAALFFSANEPPRFGEVKPSIKDRLYPIEMPYRFVSNPDPDDPLQKPKVPDVADRLLDDEAAMRGLLLLAVEHGQSLRQNGGEYSMPEGPDDRFEIYNREADPLSRFAGTVTEPADASMKIRKDDAYRVYQSAMDAWEERAAGERGFKRQFPGVLPNDVEAARSRGLATPDDEKDRVRCWKRVTWTEDAKSFMSDWMVERYSDHWDGEDATADTGSEDDAGDMEGENGALADLEAGIHDLNVTVAEVLDAPDWLEGKGHVVDAEGNIAPYVCEGSDAFGTVDEGAEVSLRNAKVEDRKGIATLVLSGITDVQTLQQPGVETAAATDGGESPEDTGDEGETGTEDEFEATGGDELEKAERPDVAGVDVPRDATDALSDARRIKQYVEQRGGSSKVYLKKTLGDDIGLVPEEKFDRAVSKAEEKGMLDVENGEIRPL